MYFVQHCFICRLSDSFVSEDAGMEPRTVAWFDPSILRHSGIILCWFSAKTFSTPWKNIGLSWFHDSANRGWSPPPPVLEIKNVFVNQSEAVSPICQPIRSCVTYFQSNQLLSGKLEISNLKFLSCQMKSQSKLVIILAKVVKLFAQIVTCDNLHSNFSF
jgi:hypothetical protein